MPLQNEDITKTSQEISGLLFCVFWVFFKIHTIKGKDNRRGLKHWEAVGTSLLRLATASVHLLHVIKSIL